MEKKRLSRFRYSLPYGIVAAIVIVVLRQPLLPARVERRPDRVRQLQADPAGPRGALPERSRRPDRRSAARSRSPTAFPGCRGRPGPAGHVRLPHQPRQGIDRRPKLFALLDRLRPGVRGRGGEIGRGGADGDHHLPVADRPARPGGPCSWPAGGSAWAAGRLGLAGASTGCTRPATSGCRSRTWPGSRRPRPN